MGDLTLRISMLVQQGHICQTCGDEVDGQITGKPRYCCECKPVHVAEQEVGPEAEFVTAKSL